MYNLKSIYGVTMFAIIKHSRNSKAKNLVKNFKKRLKLPNEGNIEEIIQQARRIQYRFCNSINSRRTQEDNAHSFAKLMWEGKVSAALKNIKQILL